METYLNNKKLIALGFLLIHSIAILIFTRGFLLTRTELPFHSTCSDVSLSPCFASQHPNHDSSSEPKPWMDKLTILQKLAFANRSSAKIFKAFADPPTTSLQRLKGLTTGGLPTFIDVGNSFGAPAIVEDNFINQLVLNGKRLVMMGDDTWTQLFPNQFQKSYPFPSFNVKDLDTVDNGCIEHLFPTLYEDDWDVLIAHFLGVDHAGHIYGVDSSPMINKLEQYNSVLEKVINILESQAGPGGLHENTMLIVMGDHGQTLNGDHGGGTAEEVETTMFAMSTKKHTTLVPPEFDTSSCKQNTDGKQICISSIDLILRQHCQLCLGYHFLSEGAFIGHINPELYALGSSSWNLDDSGLGNFGTQSAAKEWMKHFVNVLCVNAWQVKRYIDVYSNSSVVGFSSDDMSRISDLYSAAEQNWSNSVKHILMDKNGDEGSTDISALLKEQIAAYLNFFSSVVELARSKWTEFNLNLMITGFGILVISLILQFLAVFHGDKSYAVGSWLSTGAAFSLFIVTIRACSFLSNSYILEEGKVANFLLATTGLIKLRYSVMRKTMRKEAFIFLAMVSVLRVSIDIGLTKQAATSQFMSSSPSWMLGIAPDHPALTYAVEIAPILSVVILICVLYIAISKAPSEGLWKYVTIGSMVMTGGRNRIPQTVYVIGLVQLCLLASTRMFCAGKDKNWAIRTVALVSACSSPVVLMSGKQGSMLALAHLVAGYCIMRLEGVERRTQSDGQSKFSKLNPLCVVQWSLLSICMFFASGHWCAFDGLRYGAAFVGFDEFVLVRQAILLTIETFGFSIILSVFGLPLLVPIHSQTPQAHGEKRHQLFQMYMLFGVISATTVTATILCVTIQRRHLMVWGLFAPKFVFDVVGLILTDLLICLASAYYL
ncbi:phosphatidylinositolglycan class O (PIG-O) family protein [Arabidopsis lyrata subsp. lyrata]|uniref:Phosphatidylinositolglycan class O (PIG-O) family protein n=1 Tax=Arabidopsis lyrata subsp. lyrata TaxID=81972 RepID=D7LWY6_ARALL|nr:phosphatidylinositolglycan class O (PIG-O) family protein [Arabidopsis lyrata subsp. lyrata]